MKMHRGNRAISLPVAFLALGILTRVLGADPVAPSGDDPRAGYVVVQSAEPSALTAILTKAAQAFEEGAFGVAMDWYDNARALAPDRADLQQLLKLASDNRDLQREAQKKLPENPAEKDAFLKSSYDKACELLEKGDPGEASKAFRSIWLSAGKYKDTTQLLARAREKSVAAKPAADAQPAAAPAISDETRAQIDGFMVRAQMEVQAGHKDVARRLYENALKLDPTNKMIQYGLSQLSEKSAGSDPGAPVSAPIAAPVVAPAAPPAESAQTAPAPAPVSEVQSAPAKAEAPSAPKPEAEPKKEPAPKQETQTPPVSAEVPAVAPAPSPAPVEDQKAAAEEEKNAAKQHQIETARKIEELQSEAEVDLKNKDFDAAEKSFRAVLDLEPANKTASKGLDRLAEARTKIAEQQRHEQIEQALKAAEASLSGGHLEEAQSGFQAVLQLDPKNHKAEKGLKEAARKQAKAASREAKSPASAEQAPEPSAISAAPIESVSGAALHPIDAKEAEKKDASSPRSFEIAQADAKTEKPADAKPASAPAAPSEPPKMNPESKRAELEKLHREALEERRKGDIEAARKNWEAMLAIDSKNKLAATYLEQTKSELDRALADRKAKEESLARKKKAQELLNSPVTVSTDRPTPLAEFMRILSFSTPHDIQYYVASGAEADVFVNFIDKPLQEVLDTILTPRGLVWSIDEKNVITIKPEFSARTFNLTTDQMNKVRSLLDSGNLQKIVWGQTEPPAKGVELTVDERQRVLVAVGSKLHMQKIEEFMGALEGTVVPDLETQIYKIREADGPKIKALISALIASDKSTPFGLERKIFIDGSDLIVRDTPENITKIEELLLDEKFIQDLRDEKLDISNFSLVPRDVESQNSEQITVFTNRVKEAIETLLYSRTGIKAAQAEGRRLWFDPSTLQLTVVDTPTNIGKVGKYIESLPELRHQRLQKVIFLENAVAESLASDLSEVLGLAESTTGGKGGKGNEVIRRLRRGDEFTFRDLRIRLMRVEENDPNDRNDDECEITVNTGTQTSTLTLRELDTQFFESYEITAEDVQPSGGGGTTSGAGTTANRGEGTARIRIRYVEELDKGNGPGGAAATAVTAAQNQAQQAAQAEQGLTINPFGPLNALIIRYDNPSRLQEVEDLVKQLDKPTKQVEVETKFVQVNETRAREFSGDFNLEGLSNAHGLSQVFDGNWLLNSRFAQTRDQMINTFEPPIENPLAANLLKSTTALDLVLGGSSLPTLNFQLRLLEAEGIINITNGPKVAMLDAIQGRFRIEKLGPAGQNTTIPGTFSPFGTTGGNNETLENEGGSRFQSRVSTVVLEVTPQITSEKSIILEIIAELIDFDDYLGENVFITNTDASANTPLPSHIDPNPGESLAATGITGPDAFATWIVNHGRLFRTHKLIDTTARTHDGGTIVLGGWTGERAEELTSGVPVLRNMPYFGKLLFSRNQRSLNRVTLLIFLSANLLE